MRKRSYLNAAERSALRTLSLGAADLRADLPRRFSNALLSLAQTDPSWISWAEAELPNRLPALDTPGGLRLLLLVEARARARVLRHYSFFGRPHIGRLLFRLDQPFDDDGSLSPG